MRITKRQLRRIIKEEKVKLLNEQSHEAKEGRLLGDLASITSSIQEISDGLYGLEDPGEPGMAAGDEMARDLELQIERLNELFGILEAHFESTDSGRTRTPTEAESGIPDSERSVIHNRRPDW